MSLILSIIGLALLMAGGICWAIGRYSQRFSSKLWSLDNQFHADHGHDPQDKPNTTRDTEK